MALPSGMMRHSQTGMLWARKDVPKPLRAIVGKTSLKRSLQTKDLSKARALFHSVMQEFEGLISAARRALAENRAKPHQPLTIELDLPEDQVRAWAFAESMKPYNQLKAAADRIELQLQKANGSASPSESISIHQLFDKWKTERQPSHESLTEYERAKTQFVALVKDLPIAEYTAADARKWKEHVLNMRDRSGREMASASYAKIFGMVRTLFRYADRNELLVSDPFSRITLEVPKRPKKSERKDWDEAELQRWFDSPIYTKRERPRGGDGEASYWLPILALYHGFRAGELCQLDRADVVSRNGITCLSLSPSDPNETGLIKSIKTEKSARIVPLHARAINLGFLDYAATIKSDQKLFPLLQPDARGRWSGSYSKWFGNYRKKLGLSERYKDFHSLRHTWKTHARGAKLPEDVHDEISGHESKSVGRAYGKFPIPLLKEYVDKVQINIQIPNWTNAQ